ncbi:CocE/NonD family hydrolase [Arthrobacter sp. CG_A4]|uniref:CocE/NonD family hydrolase n=1 Tax=Arthrobacter sp. CG_A4 TaxID=3071706 RepID=UPI002DFE8663|nr:putative CocE/NonD family hydrolase [Arthrobacter sp. CG_A4]
MTGGSWPGYLEFPLEDGVILAADSYHSSKRGRTQGTILIRTPYGRGQYGAQAGAWQRAGYDVVVQDVRGRYGSTGEWHPYAREGHDGAATAASLARAGLLRGPLVLAGASYDAHCALEAARTLETSGSAIRAAAVVAMVPALGLFETARDPDGTPRFGDRIGWWHMHGFGRESAPPLAPAELGRRCRIAAKQGPEQLVHDAEYGPGARAAWARLWSAPRTDLKARYGRRNTPLLLVSGQNDFFAAEALAMADAWSGGMTGLLWGPWGHRLAGDLDAGTAAELRADGGLMARIQDFLASIRNGTPATESLEFSLAPETGYAWLPAERDGLLRRASTSAAPHRVPHETQSVPAPVLLPRGEP